ncbi:MAG: DUF3667 domain-containing protein [Thermomonas sp.]
MADAAHIPDKGRLLRARIRATTRDMLRGLVPGGSAIQLAQTDAAVDDAHFEVALCRNCGLERQAPHCGACGQKAVARFSARDVGDEVWQGWRLFEMAFLHAALRLARNPGLVAREYVLGARKRHVHPLKLLLFAVALLVVVLDRTGYLTAGQTRLSAQMQLVSDWARWSFSLGLFAIVIATRAVLRRRLGYNLVEHLVLALYVQFLVIAANLLNLLPLLIVDAARWATSWREASAYYMTPLELAIVGIACVQFFRLDWRRDALRIAAVLAVFFLAKKALLFAYGHFIQQVVLAHAG